MWLRVRDNDSLVLREDLVAVIGDDVWRYTVDHAPESVVFDGVEVERRGVFDVDPGQVLLARRDRTAHTEVKGQEKLLNHATISPQHNSQPNCHCSNNLRSEIRN